ncbi:MAG: hypothetical protein V3W14_03950 [Candidatus Neomarinimicrobiota bacterium]
MKPDEIIRWLLEGDVAIQNQVHNDLLGHEQGRLRQRIETEGWGAQFLALRRDDGHWGQRYYFPKWTSTHYTLLDLKNLGIAPDQPQIRASVAMVVRDEIGQDGGINPHVTLPESDVCLTGMVLNYAAYFGIAEDNLKLLVDFLLTEWMPDGGFNCDSTYRPGVVHSSLHTTLSVAEGIREYVRKGNTYRSGELLEAEAACREFMLQHRLFKSDRTGEIIDREFIMLSYPSRWRYDILRALDYFQSAAVDYDPRMEDALEVIFKKRRQDGTWPLQARHPGQTHFEMEKSGQPSRWNTLRVLRVWKHFQISA